MNAVKQKKYNLINNIFYVYKGVAKHKPYMIVLLFVSLISTVGSRFVGLFLSKYIIEFICDGISGDYLIKMVLILSTLNFLFLSGATLK